MKGSLLDELEDPLVRNYIFNMIAYPNMFLGHKYLMGLAIVTFHLI
jgi:hypothetical protein